MAARPAHIDVARLNLVRWRTWTGFLAVGCEVTPIVDCKSGGASPTKRRLRRTSSMPALKLSFNRMDDGSCERLVMSAATERLCMRCRTVNAFAAWVRRAGRSLPIWSVIVSSPSPLRSGFRLSSRPWSLRCRR